MASPTSDIITSTGERLDGEVVTLTAMRALQRQAFDTSAKHGFHDRDAQLLDPAYCEDGGWSDKNVVVDRDYLATLQDTRRLMLTVSELAEAMEHQRDNNPLVFYVCVACGLKMHEPLTHRDNHAEPCTGPYKPDGFGFELADVVIRVFDQAERMELDLPALIAAKMAWNKTRLHKHGRLF